MKETKPTNSITGSVRVIDKSGVLFRPFIDTVETLSSIGGELSGVLHESVLLRLAQDNLLRFYRRDGGKGLAHRLDLYDAQVPFRTIDKHGILFRPYRDTRKEMAQIAKKLETNETVLMRVALDMMLEHIKGDPGKAIHLLLLEQRKRRSETIAA